MYKKFLIQTIEFKKCSCYKDSTVRMKILASSMNGSLGH